MVREGKDGLSFKYVVITGKSLLLADYPPRYVREVVQLSDVTSIRVVSVRPICGGLTRINRLLFRKVVTMANGES